jgi:hypothetical protein
MTQGLRQLGTDRRGLGSRRQPGVAAAMARHIGGSVGEVDLPPTSLIQHHHLPPPPLHALCLTVEPTWQPWTKSRSELRLNLKLRTHDPDVAGPLHGHRGQQQDEQSTL